VSRVLENQPVPPRYFALMKRINRNGAELPRTRLPDFLAVEELEEALESKTTVVDIRPAQKFAAGHIPGTLNIPLSRSFLNWMGALVPENRDLYLITESDSDDALKSIFQELCKIGITRVRGIFRSDVLQDWKSRHQDVEKVAQLDPAAVDKLAAANHVQIVDVRNPDEWSKGHLPGAKHIPLAALPEKLGELDPAAPIVLHCKGGGRSSIATSLLQSQGFAKVSNLVGGYEAWVAAGFPTEADTPKRSDNGRRKKK